MSPHLSHLIHWRDLVELNHAPDSTALYLPVGIQCGLVHAKTKHQQAMVQQRASYTSLQPPHVCTDPHCDSATKLRPRKCCKTRLPPGKSIKVDTFAKKLACTDMDARHLQSFCNSFSQAVHKFADDEEHKLAQLDLKAVADKVDAAAYIARCKEIYLKDSSKTSTCPQYPLHYDDVWALLAASETTEALAILLGLEQCGACDVRAALRENYGGQFVGNGISFLLHHLIPFYLVTNVMLATMDDSSAKHVADGAKACAKQHRWEPDFKCQFCQSHPRLRASWHEDYNWCSCRLAMTSAAYFVYFSFLDLRSDVWWDCDFYTFIPGWRRELAADVLLVNGTQTMELLRKCFRFFVTCEVLFRRFHDHCSMFSPIHTAKGVEHAFNIKMEHMYEHHSILTRTPSGHDVYEQGERTWIET